MDAEDDHDLLIRIDENVGIIKERLDKGEKRFSKIESRVSSLERWKAYLGGAATLTALFVTLLFEKVRRIG
ncbi:hypothetical protein KAR91_44510 [Candidatus Pacearchaeota archaeon]|nr:hypothetical protein [Candidatus Pacearchaeota archaeon]